MNYKQIIKRVAEEVDVDINQKKDISRIQIDIEDALVDIFSLGHYPRQTHEIRVNKTGVITEDFSDTTLIDGMTLSSFTVTAGEAKLNLGQSGAIIITGLRDINTLKFVSRGTWTMQDAVLPSGTIVIYDAEENILWSDTFEVPEADTDHEFAPAQLEPNMKVVISLINEPDWTSYLDDLVITSSKNYIEMPSNFFIPKEVTFRNKLGGKLYDSKEITPEEFLRWNPTEPTEEQGENVTQVTEITESVTVLRSTSENIDFNYRYAWYFETMQDGSTRMYYKPTFDGLISVYHSFIPTPVSDPGTTIPTRRDEADLIVWNASMRYINRMFKKAQTELELAGLKTQYSELKQKYSKKMSDKVSRENNKVQTGHIIPFTLVNDTNMELN